MKKSISFLLPGLQGRPSGGVKIVLEYANYLAGQGYDVHIVYSATLNFKQESLYGKIKSLLLYPYGYVKGYTAKAWFNINGAVKEHWVLSFNQRHMPKTDYYVATARPTSFYVKDYDMPDEHKLYLIQGFEDWGVTEEEVYETYRLGLKNIVVSNWLKEKVEASGARCMLIRNGFDFDYFRLSKPIDDRSPYTVSMLYNRQELKGCGYGLEALSMVKAEYPQLKALLFGTPERPENLPGWIEYYRCPDKDTHNRIYNSSSINLAPSLQEGWGLTVGEAMICGNAVVCTDTLGFQEMVADGEDGIIVPSRNSRALADAIIKLIETPGLRIQMANHAVKKISDFRWDDSFRLFESILK